jgi:HEAT repeat protein
VDDYSDWLRPIPSTLVPKFDLSTAEGATKALMNPNQSVRYLAFKALTQMGSSAKPSLEKLAKHENPRMRARALWVLAKISPAADVVKAALSDADENVRCAGIRIARQARLATNLI